MASPHLLMTADAVGGVWQYATDLAQILARHGIRTTMVVLGPSPSPEQANAIRRIPDLTMIESGLPLEWLASDGAEIIDTQRRLATLVREIAPDLVQLNAPALLGDEPLGVPVVVVAHSCVATWWATVGDGPMPDNLSEAARLHRRGLELADHVVVPSAAFAALTQEVHQIARPSVVHNGRSFEAGEGTALHDFAFTAGRLWDQGKNIRTLDEVAGQLAIPFRAAGALQGPNGERIDLQNLYALGQLDETELARHFRACPVFVSASLYEPFGLAVLEAASAGCPLILSDIPTFRELWDDAAIFVPARSVLEFTEVIEDLVGDTSLRLELGRKAQKRAASYGPEAMAQRMMVIYEKLGLKCPSWPASPRAAA